MARFSVKEVAPCLFAIFIDILGFGLVAPLLVALFTEQDHHVFDISSDSLRYFCLGLTLMLYPLFMFFGSSFIGDLSDVIGRKKTLLLSMGGISVSFVLMGFAISIGSLWLFLLARAASGLVSASQSVALATLSDLSTPENKAMHLSYVGLIQCLGFVLGPLMGGVFSTSNYYTPFIYAGLAALVAFLWIAFGFEETHSSNTRRKINIDRLYKVFFEAYQQKPVFLLCFVFLFMQIGVGLFLPIILIFFSNNFHYSPFFLGLFNAYLGVGFAFGLLVVLPRLLKRFFPEKLCFYTLLLTALVQIASGCLSFETPQWILGFIFAVFIQQAYSLMFTSFSNATDANSQGWVMGVSVAMMAIAWAIAGFGPNLIPLIHTNGVILLGGFSLAISCLLMRIYLNKYKKKA